MLMMISFDDHNVIQYYCTMQKKSQGKLHVHVKGKKKWNLETIPNINHTVDAHGIQRKQISGSDLVYQVNWTGC